jgi:hypothetical protein
MEPLNLLEVHRDEPIRVPPIKKITYIARGFTSPLRYTWQLGETGYLELLVGLGNSKPEAAKSAKGAVKRKP